MNVQPILDTKDQGLSINAWRGQQSYFEARSKEEAVNEILEMQIENHELWASLGIAIQHHGQLLDNIYANVEKAQAYVKEGNENLLVVSARARVRCCAEPKSDATRREGFTSYLFIRCLLVLFQGCTTTTSYC